MNVLQVQFFSTQTHGQDTFHFFSSQTNTNQWQNRSLLWFFAFSSFRSFLGLHWRKILLFLGPQLTELGHDCVGHKIPQGLRPCHCLTLLHISTSPHCGCLSPSLPPSLPWAMSSSIWWIIPRNHFRRQIVLHPPFFRWKKRHRNKMTSPTSCKCTVTKLNKFKSIQTENVYTQSLQCTGLRKWYMCVCVHL